MLLIKYWIADQVRDDTLHMFNPDEIRKDFPIFNRTISGKPIVYLDSAATSLKPKPVLDAMWKYYTDYTANIHRGIYTLSEEATAIYDSARQKVATFIGSNKTEEVIFTRNATEALNLVASTYGKQKVGKDDSVVTTTIEHHANFVPWQQLGGKFSVIPLGKDGFIEQQLLKKYITRTTKIFAFSSISNVLGTIQNVREIVDSVRNLAPECCIVVDAAQAVPRGNVNVSEWGADFIVFSGHKMLGPTGIGVLWGKYELLEKMPPYQFGGDMIREVTIEKTTFAFPPQKFEAGTPDIAGAIGLGAAIDYLTNIGLDAVRQHEHDMVVYALKGMKEIDGITLLGPENSDLRGSVIAFTLKGIHPHDIAQVLSEDNICVRAGHHCAMPLHTSLHISASARISFYVYTTKEDIDMFIERLVKVKKTFT